MNTQRFADLPADEQVLIRAWARQRHAEGVGYSAICRELALRGVATHHPSVRRWCDEAARRVHNKQTQTRARRRRKSDLEFRRRHRAADRQRRKLRGYYRLRRKSTKYREKDNKRVHARLARLRQTNPQYKISHLLRVRIRKALQHGYKAGSAVRDLGCTVAECTEYLESLFQPGMTWENHGEWEIDHVCPLASFDLSNREQFLQACHYTNLQPLWRSDNNAKGARLPVPLPLAASRNAQVGLPQAS